MTPGFRISEPSQQLKDESEINKPCHPNPCKNGQLCVVNRKNCDSNENCLKYRCLPGKIVIDAVKLTVVPIQAINIRSFSKR